MAALIENKLTVNGNGICYKKTLQFEFKLKKFHPQLKFSEQILLFTGGFICISYSNLFSACHKLFERFVFNLYIRAVTSFKSDCASVFL